MDSGRGSGGGKTPRGRKPRGSPRGRGQSHDSPSSKAPSSASSSPAVVLSSQSQSPTVSSTASPSLPAATTRARNDDEPKVSKQASTSEESKPATATSSPKPAEVPPPPKDVFEVKSKTTMEAAASKQPETSEEKKDQAEQQKEKEDSQDKESSSPESEQADVPQSTSKSNLTEKVTEEPKTPELLPPEIPPLPTETTEEKVEEVLGKKTTPKRETAKTLVVSKPIETPRSTDAPISVDIASCGVESGEDNGPRPSSSTSQYGRSGSTSPAYAYALRGPVGKPGYIGGVGSTADEENEGGESGRLRRGSAIAAVETAVKGFSGRQWTLLIIFGLIDLLSAITISLQAPFYPAEAERKGATATEYGLVFGIFEFVVFLTSPFFGKYMNKLGPKTVFNIGILLTSISVICFGLLDRINDHTLFISLCFICRIFEALGCAGFFTATFTIIAMEFPESVATTFASLETFFGLGLIVGPTVGGALYGVGGFPLPFFVTGAALLITGFFSSFVMPKIDRAMDDDGKEQVGYGIWTILKIPSVALAALSIATTSMSLGFVSATLEPHIRRFALTPLQTGLVFIINGGMYALTAPIWGFICDWLNRPIYVAILGNAFNFVAFLLIGPAAFMPFDTILWVTIVGLLIQGLAFGCCLVSGFIVGLKDSMKYGLPDNMATYGVASGLWTSMISLGAWVGPSAAGVLYDTVGFRDGSYLILVSSLVVGVSILIHTIATRASSSASDTESQPLLRPISPLAGKKDVESGQKSSAYGSTSDTSGGGGSALV